MEFRFGEISIMKRIFGSGICGLVFISLSCQPRELRQDPVTKPADPGALGTLRKDIRKKMKEEINPSLSWISMNLFHPKDAAAAPDRFQEIRRSADRMQSTASQLAALSSSNGQAPLEFRTYAIELKFAVEAMMEAAHEENAKKTIHAFWHVKARCTICHRVFRFGQIAPRRKKEEGQP
jgi:hypothetical protein